ncbi:MAG: hypothetical protein CVU56_13820 [Deltaproteobacteria bacterium HGW-Deltaproteobacteria-14]|nr:MAG: hypothetical protein CVU56_13820 [Deltaproteobacteria bacterium HGW-Deltaproteobacteria-14]
MAPLNLSGITNARYVLTVRNGPNGTGEVVWTRALSSQQYGDGAGSLSYVGTCDASTGANTVTLELTGLDDVDGEVPTSSYMNPTPVIREVDCVENADVPVRFDITLARRAEQGFFDVAVQFSDIFCSAKLDCENADHSDLELLHGPGGERDLTVVLGFACTGSVTGTTYLYMDNLVVACSGLAQDVIVAPTGIGNITPTANPGGYLFGAAVYRGVEGFAGKAYWNVALGLDALKFGAAGACTLKTRATASDTPFPQEPGGFPLPAGTVYPVITWSVPLSDATHRVCTKHEVNAGTEVATSYEGYLPLTNGFTWNPTVVYFQHRFQPIHPSSPNGQVLSAGAPICNPGCDRGACVAQGDVNQCSCDGTGFAGDTCATPVCTAPCVHGACVAPDTCACADGFWGATCASVCAPGACAGTMRCDQGTGDATACVGTCEAGTYGATCLEACLPVANCAVTPTCSDGSGSACASCASGFLPDGDGACVECLGAGDCPEVGGDCYVSACEAGACVGNVVAAGTSCGDPTVTACSAADSCDDAGTCLANDVDAGTSCGDPGNACVVQDTCDGSGACTDNGFASAGTACGSAADTVCDNPDSCDGAGGCSANPEPPTTVCRGSAGVCDVVEKCTGAGACPSDGFVAAATECRAAASECDVAESCTGSAAACPTDEFKPSGASCGSAADTTCDHADSCNGGGACLVNYATNGTSCSNGVYCDGAETCTSGVCLDRSDPCDPASAVCDEVGDTCHAIRTSCLTWREAGYTTSGAYTIDPDGPSGAIAPFVVWCDMVIDGGGYTFLKVKLGAAVGNGGLGGAEAACDAYGLQLFIPRSPAHLAAAWLVATGPDFGESNALYLRLFGIYPSAKGATCAYTQLATGNPSCAWVAGDGGPFWVSNRVDHWEPNGNNDLGSGMRYDFSGGVATSWDDIAAPGYTSDRFMCDMGDKVFIPTSCLGWYDLGFVTNGTYPIDPDGEGGAAAYNATCDMTNGGWTRVAHEDFESGSPTGWTFNGNPFSTTTSCGSLGKLLGGYNVTGNGTLLKTYAWNSALPHTQARLNVDFIKIDSWDTEYGKINFTAPPADPATGTAWTQSFGNGGGVSECGAVSTSWHEVKVPVTLTIAHTTASAAVRGNATLSGGGAEDESWALDNVVIWVK